MIALVVTIIVLLILSGVTIATLTGDNGLFEKARIAKEKTEEKRIEEQDALSEMENKIDNYKTLERAGSTGGTVTAVEDETLLDISTYSSEGLSICDERIRDMQGGYRIVGNIVYVYIEATINKDLAKDDAWLLIYNMPLAKQQDIPLQVCIRNTSLSVGLYSCNAGITKGNGTSLTQQGGRIGIGVGDRDISKDFHITIIGKYLKADETSEE